MIKVYVELYDGTKKYLESSWKQEDEKNLKDIFGVSMKKEKRNNEINVRTNF